MNHFLVIFWYFDLWTASVLSFYGIGLWFFNLNQCISTSTKNSFNRFGFVLILLRHDLLTWISQVRRSWCISFTHAVYQSSPMHPPLKNIHLIKSKTVPLQLMMRFVCFLALIDGRVLGLYESRLDTNPWLTFFMLQKTNLRLLSWLIGILSSLILLKTWKLNENVNVDRNSKFVLSSSFQ